MMASSTGALRTRRVRGKGVRVPDPPSNPVCELPLLRRVRFRLEALVFQAIGAAVSYLPRRIMIALGQGTGWTIYHVAWSWRQVALDNLRYVSGDSKSPREIERIARQSFANLGASFLELFWMRRFDPREIGLFVEMDEASIQAVKRANAPGKGVIVVPTHFGRWEIMGLAYNQAGYSVTFVAKRLHNPYLDDYLNGIRCRTGNRVCYIGGAVQEMRETLKGGGGVATLIDQKEPLHRGGILIDFLGRPAPTTTSIATLAIDQGAALLPVYCLPLPRGRCRAVFGPLIEYEVTGDREADIHRITRQCVEATEDIIRRYPEYWLWAHKRWKIPKASL